MPRGVAERVGPVAPVAAVPPRQHREGREPVGVGRSLAVRRQRRRPLGRPGREGDPQRRLLHPQHRVAVDQRQAGQRPALGRQRVERGARGRHRAPPPPARPRPRCAAGCEHAATTRSTGSAARAEPAPARATATAARSPAHPSPPGSRARSPRSPMPHERPIAARTAAPRAPTPAGRRPDARCAARRSAAPRDPAARARAGRAAAAPAARPAGRTRRRRPAAPRRPAAGRATTDPGPRAARTRAAARRAPAAGRARPARGASVSIGTAISAPETSWYEVATPRPRAASRTSLSRSPAPMADTVEQVRMTTATTTSGLRLDASGLSVAVASAEATAIDLCLETPGGRERRHPLERVGDVWLGHVEGVREGDRYGLRAYGPACDPSVLLVDPLARAVDGRWSVAVADVAAASAPLRRPWAETVIYEAHVRGFTRLHAGRAARAARHLRRPRASRRRWPSWCASASRRSSCCRCTSSATSSTSVDRPPQLLGLQPGRASARRTPPTRPRAAAAARWPSSARSSPRCTTPASR